MVKYQFKDQKITFKIFYNKQSKQDHKLQVRFYINDHFIAITYEKHDFNVYVLIKHTKYIIKKVIKHLNQNKNFSYSFEYINKIKKYLKPINPKKQEGCEKHTEYLPYCNNCITKLKKEIKEKE